MLIKLAVIDRNLNFVDDKLHHFELHSLLSYIAKTLNHQLEAHIALNKLFTSTC